MQTGGQCKGSRWWSSFHLSVQRFRSYSRGCCDSVAKSLDVESHFIECTLILSSFFIYAQADDSLVVATCFSCVDDPKVAFASPAHPCDRYHEILVAHSFYTEAPP